MVRRISMYARLLRANRRLSQCLKFRTGLGKGNEDHANLLSSNTGSWAEAEGLEGVSVIHGELRVAEPSLGNELVWAAEVFLRVEHNNARNRDRRLVGAVLGIGQVRRALCQEGILTSFGTNLPARWSSMFVLRGRWAGVGG